MISRGFSLNTLAGTNARGTYQFGGLSSLLAGTPSQFRILLGGSQSNPERGWRRILFGWFVQDDFRIRPNLTLNLGLRHEFFTNPSEVHGWNGDLINVTDATNTLGPPFALKQTELLLRGLAWPGIQPVRARPPSGWALGYSTTCGRANPVWRSR